MGTFIDTISLIVQVILRQGHKTLFYYENNQP